jgi:uncharacterized protein (DUF302 family)
MTGFTLAVSVDGPYAETVDRTREALAEQGFGVLTEIDLARTLADKLGVEVDRQVVLGACRPQLAYAALQAEPSIAAVLPCNVVVREVDEGTTLVQAFDPAAMMALADNPALDSVAAEARDRISAALATLARSDRAADATSRRP